MSGVGDVKDARSSMGWEDPLEESEQPSPVLSPGESHGQGSPAATVIAPHRAGHSRSDGARVPNFL